MSTLFYIEDDLIAGLLALDSLMNKGEISPRDFESRLSRIGTALQKLANFSEGVNTIFAIFDQLVGLRTSARDARISSPTITSQVGTRQVTKVFLAMPPVETAPALVLVPPRPMTEKVA